MKKYIGICFAGLMLSLAACGGGDSDSSGTKIDTNESSNTIIATSCSVSTIAGVRTHTATEAGCLLKLQAGTQTGVCTAKALKMLSGTGFTAKQVQEQGASFSAKGLTINGEALKCA